MKERVGDEKLIIISVAVRGIMSNSNCSVLCCIGRLCTCKLQLNRCLNKKNSDTALQEIVISSTKSSQTNPFSGIANVTPPVNCPKRHLDLYVPPRLWITSSFSSSTSYQSPRFQLTCSYNWHFLFYLSSSITLSSQA